jgi:hypothetical protein
MRFEAARGELTPRKFPGLIMWAGSIRGPLVPPGRYQVRLTRDKLSAANQGVISIRDVRKQLDAYVERVKDRKVIDAAKALSKN